MARLAAMESGEYYPTPVSVVGHIATYLSPPTSHRGVLRLFDPCCGEGLALDALAHALAPHTNRPLETWGVEISPERAAEASHRLDLVIQAPLETVVWSPVRYGIASILFLNPPYDTNDRGGRMEFDFLKLAMPSLVSGGMMAYIIPTTAVEYRMARFLVQHFQDIRAFRFGDADDVSGYDAFKQIVICATRRRDSLAKYDVFKPVHRDVIESILQHCSTSVVYEQQRGGSVKDTMPTRLPEGTRYSVPIARSNGNVRRYRYLDHELEDMAARTWKVARDDMAEALLDRATSMPRPLVELRTGHTAMVVAGGLMGKVETEGRVFKGRSLKSTIVFPDPEDPRREIHREVWKPHMVQLSPEGVVHHNENNSVRTFLQSNIDIFKRYIEKHLRPYGLGASPQEEAILDSLSLDKKLPRAKKVGLIPDQRAKAVAMTRSIAQDSVAILVAEMGYGKTRTSLASIELMQDYPLLVICPPHVYPKWVREAEASVPGLRAVYANSITDLENIRANYKPGDKLLVMMKRSSIKLGPGWGRVAETRYTLSKKLDERAPFVQAVSRYKQLRAQLLADRENDTLRQQVRDARREALKAARDYPTCPNCGRPLSKKEKRSAQPLLCNAEISSWDPEEMTEVEHRCPGALFQFGGKYGRYRRWPLADYVRRKMKGFFKSLIIDEVHQYKAMDSDQGWAFHLLVVTIPHKIALTGTLVDGKASNLFVLLYRLLKRVRDDFAFNDVKRWVSRFGVLETTYEYDDEQHGAYSGQRRRRVSTKERPGISPEIVQYILPNTIFASIKDLGIEMPPFKEEYIVFTPTQAMERDLTRLHNFTWDQLLKHWPHYTSSWLQWNLSRPNSCFRTEVVKGHDDRELVLPQVIEDGLLPKEAWLVSTIKAELAADRKVVLYVRQTGTRDIRQHLVNILTEANIPGVEVLKSSIPPQKREAWLKKHPSNVLITNPRLVETGLDLVQFCTAIFYEPDYSLYTLWQACRRIWRLGQSRPVKVYYLSYAGTLEEKAFALLGQKVKAAQLLYGEEVSSALVDDPGDASLVMALIQAIKDGEDLKLEHDATFFSDNQHTYTNSATGSPTQPSLSVFERWAKENGHSYQHVKPKLRRRREVPSAQMSLL